MTRTILISTHGAASRAMLLNIRHGEQKDFWDTGVPKNCAVHDRRFGTSERQYIKMGNKGTGYYIL